MEILKAFGKYIWQLMIVWIIGSFLLVLDLLGGVEKLFPKFELQSWWYPTIFTLCFVVANVLLYIRQELEKLSLKNRIVELEALEANICLKVEGVPELGVSEHSIDEQGLPRQGAIQITLEFENIGYKPGELIWSINRDETSIPAPFDLDPNSDGGFNTSLKEIDGQERDYRYLNIPIRITEQNPIEFIEALNSSEVYNIVIDYYTKGIGSISPQQKLVIEGNFLEARREVHIYLKKRGLDSLAELVNFW